MTSQTLLGRCSSFSVLRLLCYPLRMKTEHPFYGFTAEWHSEVDAQLERMQSELTALLAEYRRVAANTNRNGYTATTIETALTSLQMCGLRCNVSKTHTANSPRTAQFFKVHRGKTMLYCLLECKFSKVTRGRA